MKIRVLSFMLALVAQTQVFQVSSFFLKVSIFVVFFLLSVLSVNAQQSQPITQFFFNRFMLNPAAAGSQGYSSVGMTIKDQWTGFGNSPTVQVLYGQYRLSRQGFSGNRNVNRSSSGNPERIGLGVALFNDIRGPLRTTGAQFTYAYHLEDQYGQLSFGLTGSIFQFYANRDKMITEHFDNYLASINLSRFIPDAMFGVHYTSSDYYAGLSVSNLFQSYLTFGGRNSRHYRIERQYTLLGGYVFEINRAWTVVPGLQYKLTDHFAQQLDFNLLLYWYDQLWGGFAFRTAGGGAVGGFNFLVGMRYREYHFGYAFDHSLSNMGRYSWGSHELMLSITFGTYDKFFRYNRRYEFQEIQARRRVFNRN